jgi:hypothetical protein
MLKPSLLRRLSQENEIRIVPTGKMEKEGLVKLFRGKIQIV